MSPFNTAGSISIYRSMFSCHFGPNVSALKTKYCLWLILQFNISCIIHTSLTQEFNF